MKPPFRSTGDKVAFFAPSHSRYVCAEIESSPPIAVANRPSRGPWEEFEVEAGEMEGTFAFKAANGLYLSAPEDLNIYAQAEKVQSWESFRPHYQTDGTIAWETAQHRFLRAVDTGELKGDALSAGAWECFQVEGWSYAGGEATVNPLIGFVSKDHRAFTDDSGPRVYAACHFFEAFSLFCRDPQLVADQLRTIAGAYPVIRFLDVVGYYDYWKGREVSPHAFIAQGGYQVEATTDYWGNLLRFYQLLNELGLKTHHTRGDLQMFGGIGEIKDHVRQVCRLIRDNGLQHVIEIMEVCNEYELNGLDSADDAREIGKAIHEEIPQTLMTHGAPLGTEEPDEIENAARGADVANIHGMRPGEFVDVLRHIFSIRREGFEDANQSIIQGEPFGPGDDVSGTRHDGDPLGRSDDVEFLVAAALMAALTGQRWTYMSGFGVRWNGYIETQPGFQEVSKALSVLPPDIFHWHTTRGGSSNNPFRSPSGYYGDPGVGHGPARIDGSESGGQFHLLVYGGKAPYEIEAAVDLDYEVVSLPSMEVELAGRLRAGERITLNYRIGRLVRSPR